MKRVATIALVLAAFLAAAPAYAAIGGATNITSGSNAGSPFDTTGTPYDSVESASPVSSVNNQLNQTQQTAADLSAAQNPAPAPAGNGTGAGINGSPDAAFGWLLGGIMSIFAWLAGTAGVLLNDTVYYTVVAMGQVANPNQLSALGVAWRILRDLGNIVLIFGFVAIGISTIVGYDSYGVGKRLPMLLVVAILINFSLFATEAVIDVGNLFATQIYTQINNGQTPQLITGLSLDPSSSNNPINGGISGTVMNALGLQSLYNVNSAGAGSGNAQSAIPTGTAGSTINNNEVMLVGILASLLFLLLAFVLFSITIILVVRFVTLVLLMVVAPLGFAGLIVPGLDKTARDWWNTLIKEATVAPALLLVLYIALAVITDKSFLSSLGATGGVGGAGYTAVASGATDAASLAGYAGILLAFLIAMGLLMACVILAKRMGAIGASAATKWAGAATFGATAFVARRSVGRVSNYASSKIRASSLGRTEFGRGLLTVTDKGAKSSFDFRGIKALQGAAKGQGIDLGKAQEGGYKKIRDDATERRVKHGESLELTKKESGEKKALDDQLETAKKRQVQDLLAADRLDTPEARKAARTTANDEYKRAERRLQAGEYDADGNQTAKGLNDYKDLGQKKYIEHLEKRSSPFSLGLLQDALTRGVSSGIAEGLGLAVAGTALGTAAVAGVGIGATLAAGYAGGVSPGANKDAVKKLKKKIKDQSLDQLRKALASGGGGGAAAAAAAEEE